MAVSPPFKVFSGQGKYVAACKEAEAAACLMGMYGSGAVVRWGDTSGPVVWREGHEAMSGGDSYDGAATTMLERVLAHNVASYKRLTGKEMPV